MDKLRRGAGLAPVLLIAALAVTFVSIVAAWASSQSMLESGLETRQRAKALAEGALHRALAAVACRTLGDLNWQFQDGQGEASVSLDPTWAIQHSIPVSTDNMAGDVAVQGGNGDPVPPRCLQLIAVGRSGLACIQVECLIKRSGYPYVIASQGPVVARRGLVVGTVGPGPNLEAGDLVTNDASGNAVFLGPACNITGDVRASGSISVDPNSVVQGRTLAHASQVELPRIPIESFLPPQPAILSGVLAGQTLVGPCQALRDLHVSGDLCLDGAQLYVPGNFWVEGSIRGRGLVVCTGNLTVTGGAELGSLEQAVLISAGDVRLEGRDQAVSRFQGMVYSGGNFQARNVSLVGVFVSRGPGGMLLDSVDLIPHKDLGQIDPSQERLASVAVRARRSGDDSYNLTYQLSPYGPVTSAKATRAAAAQMTFSIELLVRRKEGRSLYQVADRLLGLTFQADSSEGALLRLQRLARLHVLRELSQEEVSLNDTDLNSLRRKLEQLGQFTSDPRRSGLASFDLSEFVGPESSLQVLSWRVK